MKANTGKAGPENTMNGEGRGRVGIAYQVDSRHSRVKWIGPYEGGSRERERERGRADRSKRRLSRWLFNYDNLLEERREEGGGGDRYAFHAPARFVNPPVAHPVSR